MNYSQRIIYYPQTPEFLYDKMAKVIGELDYEITSDEKIPNQIVSKYPYMIAKKGNHEVMITFRRKFNETEIEVHVSQIGEKVKTEFLEQQRDEIVRKFEEKIK